ncbi:hypothetical protein BZG36_04339 [Bifiguratus adelaidae]|uniref:Trafficking protein particle complex subunit 2-like protein n=1 Tax=Bifiguratus adelaidae TaxID=1938954 RepID=A0A261XW20_9FUNG|nr:hypothetical protein BZG36_04339 [Bifiguratus adelaidae]
MSDPSRFQCRMYENEFPKPDDLVVVNVRQIEDMGAYVKLLEYNDREGMILLSELSRRRIRSVQKLIRVGRNEVVVVLRVDEEKGYIDLSKRRVSPEEVTKCEDRYNKSKAVHSILRHVAEKHDIPLIELYQKFGWPLYRKYGHAYDAFKMAIADPEPVLEGLDMPANIRDELLSNIVRRMKPQPVKIRAHIDLRCTGSDGVEAIKKALQAGEACGTADVPLKITYLAAPLYVITADALEKNIGFEVMENALETIKETVEGYKHSRFAISKEAKLVNETDDRDFAALMAQAEKENEMVSGDEDEDIAAGSDDDEVVRPHNLPMNIHINCIAVIGKQNNPLYIRNCNPAHPDLKFHYLAHTAIDVIEERVAAGPKAADLYLGLLYSMEDLAVYGYMTNTRVKFVVVITVPDGLVRDSDMKMIFRQIHAAYTAQVCNPFYTTDSSKPITAKKFTQAIDAIDAIAVQQHV